MSTYVEKIVERFGGVRPMAASLGLPPTTVSSWKVRGVIPAKRQSEVLEAARESGIPLVPGDFFPELSTTSRGKSESDIGVPPTTSYRVLGG